MSGFVPHRPTSVAEEERLINLLFALLNAAKTGSTWLSSAQLRALVPGYDEQEEQSEGSVAENTARKRLLRDIDLLRSAGVPIVVKQAGDMYLYRVREDLYQLPPVTFTAEEAAVLGLAGELGRSGELGAFARSGWTKLAAAGVSRDLTDPSAQEIGMTNDLGAVSAKVLVPLIAAIQRGLRVELQYRFSAVAEPVTRTLDPWGVVTVRDRLYVVGYDLDRQEPRTFRLVRLVGAEQTSTPIEHAFQGDRSELIGVVEHALQRGRQRIDARVQLSPGRAVEIRRFANHISADEVAELHNVDREWLVRTCAGYGEHAVVLEPADARAEVISLLRRSIGMEA